MSAYAEGLLPCAVFGVTWSEPLYELASHAVRMFCVCGKSLALCKFWYNADIYELETQTVGLFSVC